MIDIFSNQPSYATTIQQQQRSIASDDPKLSVTQTIENALKDAAAETSAPSEFANALAQIDEQNLSHNQSRFETKTTLVSPDQNNKNKPFGAGDLIDMINPLHHIPVVATAYRNMSGDEIHPASRIIGGGIFGGPIGAAAGLINAAVENETGKDVGETAFDMIAKNSSEPLPKPYIERLTQNIHNHERETISRVSLDMETILVQDLYEEERDF